MSEGEAAATLDEIDRLLARTKRAIVAAHVADHLIVWGLVWMAAFGTSHATSWHEGLIWGVIAGAGALASGVIGARTRRAFESPDRNRVFQFFAALGAFAIVWAVILYPFNLRHFGVYVGTVFMFAYVAGGLWFGRFFVWLGAGVTALAVAGVLLLPTWLDLLMAAGGGGALLVSGLYIRRTWT